jgi:hypothetical protein
MHTIPLIDIRNSDYPSVLKQHKESALALLTASRNTFGFASRLLSYAALPLGDWLSETWLRRTPSPYVSEILEFSKILQTSGVIALNACYEWGCTSFIQQDQGIITLNRVMDWPFPDLGKHIMVLHAKGTAGEYHNVTWLGVSGVFQGIAGGRFAATLNQAPMRRHGIGLVGDWLKNRFLLGKHPHIPPAHLLRQVFETAPDYQAARTMLEQTPLAIPVTYILAGINQGEGVVIERTETNFRTLEIKDKPILASTNHFQTDVGMGERWTARPILNAERFEAACALIDNTDLNWFKPPIANRFSRLVMQTSAHSYTLTVQGVEGEKVVSNLFCINTDSPYVSYAI